ncbi:hypothetical protein HII31_07927, partial [Pseudocercospora fuligena]
MLSSSAIHADLQDQYHISDTSGTTIVIVYPVFSKLDLQGELQHSRGCSDRDPPSPKYPNPCQPILQGNSGRRPNVGTSATITTWAAQMTLQPSLGFNDYSGLGVHSISASAGHSSRMTKLRARLLCSDSARSVPSVTADIYRQSGKHSKSLPKETPTPDRGHKLPTCSAASPRIHGTDHHKSISQDEGYTLKCHRSIIAWKASR